MKSESKETQNDENKESSAVQAKEKAEGTEEHNPEVISEEFQNKVMDLCKEYKDSKQCLEYMRSRSQDHLDELYKKEREKNSPDEFSTVGMPE